MSMIMEEAVLTLEPNLKVGLLPIIASNFSYSIIISSSIYLMLYLFDRFDVISISNKFLYGIIFFLALFIIPILVNVIILSRTTYLFYDTHLSKEFRLLGIKKHSIPYNQIRNIVTNVNIWNRLSSAGRIEIHSANDKENMMILNYINNPEEIEEKIYSIIGKKKTQNPNKEYDLNLI